MPEALTPEEQKFKEQEFLLFSTEALTGFLKVLMAKVKREANEAAKQLEK